MRLLMGIVLGCALTIGAAYAVDHRDELSVTRPMVNWDVVGKNVDDLIALARDGWKKIAG